MIKGQVANTGNLFMGLSHENIRRLRGGQTLFVNCADVRLSGEVRLCALPKGMPFMVCYDPETGVVAVAVPPQELERMMTEGEAKICSRLIGSPFDILVMVGTTEQAILDRMAISSPVVHPASNQKH